MTDHTPQAVLWDMDGTLIDSEPLWLEAELAMLARFGISMSADTHARLIGSGLRDAASHFQELGVPLSIPEIIAEWVDGVQRGIEAGGAQWRPGAVELLQSLGEAGIPSALVTMSVRSLAETVVAQLPAGSFSAIVAGDEVQHEKPHPEPYLRGAELLGVSIEHCLAIEDSPTGVRSARSSGAVTVGVTNLVSLDEAPAHLVVGGLAGVDASVAGQWFCRTRSSVAQEVAR